MTKSTGPSKASTGRMNTRTTNRRRRHAALTIVGALALTFAAANKAGDRKGQADQSKDDQADEDKGTDKTLPPILQQALEEKEQQVTEARREAIKLIEDYLRENPKGSAGYRAKEQAESLYKL